MLSFCQPCANAVCVHLNKEGQSRDADTNNKEERLQKQTSSAVAQSTAFTSHWMYSWVSTCFSSFNMLLCLSLCAEFTCCQCTKLIHFLTCAGISCRDSHCENGLVRCCLYTPRRLQQTAVSCKRSNCNSIKKSWTSHVWGFIQRPQTTGPPVLSCRFARKLICGLSLNYHELHHESLHCHQLEEELDYHLLENDYSFDALQAYCFRINM